MVLASLFLLGGIAICAHAAAPPTVLVSSVSPSAGSTEGGTRITIFGSRFERGGTEGTTTVFIGPNVCETIEYYSNDNQIVCITPKSSISGKQPVNVISHVSGDDIYQSAKCLTSCDFNYQAGFTPLLIEAALGGASGDEIHMRGYFRSKYARDYEVMVDGHHCELEYEDDDTIASYTSHLNYLSCRLPDITAGRYNITFNIQSSNTYWSAGYADTANYAWQAENDQPYHIEFHPVVSSTSSASTGLHGGDKLTVTGTGFDANTCENNVVLAAGIDCRVLTCSSTEITCVLGAYNASVPAVSSRGLSLRVWPRSQGWTPTELSLDSTETSAVRSPRINTDDQYNTEAVGLFVPEQSAWYKFFCAGDDYCELEMSSDETAANLQTVVQGPRYLSNYWIDDRQISDPMYLEAGMRYYTRVRHTEYGGGDFYQVAMQILNASKPVTATEKLHESIRERQVIRLSTIVQREKQLLNFTNVYNGTYLVSIDGKLSDKLDFERNSDLESALESLSSCNNIGVHRTVSGNTTTLLVTFECATYTHYPMISIVQGISASLNPLPGRVASVSVTRTQTASAPLSGEFRLGYQGNWTQYMSHNLNADNVVDALEEASSLEKLDVWRSGNTMDYVQLLVQCWLPHGDIDTIDVDISRLAGSNVSYTVEVQQEGSNDRFFDPIPARFFQRVYTDSNASVVVKTNGIASSCLDTGFENSSCAFAYSSNLTPEVLSVSGPAVLTNGDMIVVTGAGFGSVGSDVEVTVGGTECVLSLFASDSISCRVGHMTAGAVSIVVTVQGAGRASIHENVSLAYGFSLDNVSPLQGSFAGGMLLTISGTGFSPSLTANTILIGSEPCVLEQASASQLVCRTPADATLASISAPGSGNASKAVVINGQTYASPFLYEWGITPLVDSISPSSLSSGVTTSVTISGTFIALNKDADACGGVLLDVQFQGRLCSNPVLSSGLDEITCTLLRGDAPAFGNQTNILPSLSLCTKIGNMNAFVPPNVTVDLNSRVTAINAHYGTISGGAELIIDGRGFGTTTANVGVLVKNATVSVACRVTSSSESQVNCTLDAAASEVPNANVEVNVNGFVARSTTAISHFEIRRGLAASHVSPLYIERQSVVSFQGVFQGIPEVTIGDTPCVLLSSNASSIVCTAGAATAGVYDAKINLKPYGYAEAAGLSVTYNSSLTALSYHQVSLRGGLEIIATGDGFSLVPQDNVFEFDGVAAHVVWSNYTQARLVVPRHTLSQTHSSVVSVTIKPTNVALRELSSASTTCASAVDCTITYNASITASTQSISPSSGVSGDVVTLHGTGLAGATVTIGGHMCSVDTQASNASTIVCAVGNTPGGQHAVYVQTSSGIADGTLTFTSLFNVSHLSQTSFGHGGGEMLTLTGHGFGDNELGTEVDICHRSCSIIESNYSHVVCSVPSITSASIQANLGYVEPSVLSGTILGGGMSNDEALEAFDGDFEIYPSGSRDSCTITMDLGENVYASITRVRFFPVLTDSTRVQRGNFLVSEDGITWSEIAAIGTGYHDGWNAITLDTPSSYSRFIQYRGNYDSYCRVAELEFQGVVVHTLSDTCNLVAGANPVAPHVSLGMSLFDQSAFTSVADSAVATQHDIAVMFEQSNTPRIVSISPRWGSSLGGTVVTLTGERLSDLATVELNGYDCHSVNVVSASEVTCVTGVRKLLLPRTLVAQTATGNTAVHESDVLFRYLDLWSQVNTWANDEPPVEGDTVVIPNDQVVLMDVSPPKLFLLLIQGELVFDRRDLELHAHYIFVSGGKLEIGSEEEPFLNKTTITLYGDRFTSIGIPRLGSKMLVAANARNVNPLSQGEGVLVPTTRRASIDIHGRPRRRTWTKVAQTVTSGTNNILLSEPVDFEAGDLIFLTSHDNMNEIEELTVASLSSDGLTIITVETIKHTHVSVHQTIQGYDVDMRVEVGLLSRNIVIQGEPGKSEAQNFGSHLLAAGGARLRLENAEVRRCGQSGILGRYCTHFHMSGDLPDSYIRHNSIHHSFQRAVTVHHTHYALVQNNVAYHIKGHSIFVEDGDEFFNVIEANLVAKTLHLFVMLKGDTKPASFWMASPSNLWRNNVAAGSVNDGYWFELPSNPHGPSFTTSICPIHGHMYEFRNNTAHANGVHGLRIYPQYTPRVDPCIAWSGPAPQYFHDFQSHYNGQNGIFGKLNGDLHHVRAKLIGNGAEEQHWTKFEAVEYRDNDPNIVDGLFMHDLSGERSDSQPGLFMPQHEFFHVSGATFVNYQGIGAIAGCAKCDSQQNMRQGGFTFRLEGLSFVNTEKRVKWTAPMKQIFHDLDGSLTGFVNGTATPYYKFNHYPGLCDHMNETWDNGIVCNGDVRVRRLQIDGQEPKELDDQSIVLQQSTNASFSDSVRFRVKEIYGWAVPVVTNFTYKIAIDSLVDFREIAIRYSEPEYLTQPEHMILQWKWTDYRYSFDVTYGNPSGSVMRAPASLIDSFDESSPYGLGKNDHNAKEWTVVLSNSGIDKTLSKAHQYLLTADAIQCAPGRCGFFSDEPLFDPWLYTNTSNWCRFQGHANYSLWYSSKTPTAPTCPGTLGQLPQANDNVLIDARMYVVMNVNPPVLNNLIIIGKLHFEDTADRTLEASTIAVWGDLQVGSAGNPFTHQADITVRGDRTSPTLIVHNSRFLGNKVMTILGRLELHGKPYLTGWTRLSSTLDVGSKTLALVEPVDWPVGASIVVSSTEYSSSETEELVIESVDASGMFINVTQAAGYRHFAGQVQVGASKSKFLGASVALLERNVRFQGAQGSGQGTNYGGHIVVTDITHEDGIKVGTSHITNVQLSHCGKSGMEHACMLFKYDRTYPADQETMNLVSQVVIAHGLNYGIVSEGSVALTVEDSVIHRTFRTGVELDAATKKATFTSNLVIDNRISVDASPDWIVPFGGFYIDTYSVTLRDNIVAGTQDTGIVFRPNTCGQTSTISNNEVVSALVGVFALADTGTCFSISGMTVWKAAHIGITTIDQRVEIEVDSSYVSDSHIGISLNFFNIKHHHSTRISNTVIAGTTAASTCQASLTCRAATQSDVQGISSTCGSVLGTGYRHVGMLLPQYTNRGKTCGQDDLPVCRPPTRPERLCGMGWDREYGLPATYHAKISLDHVTFASFHESQCGGLKSFGLLTNPSQRSLSPEQSYSNIEWYDTPTSSQFFFSKYDMTHSGCSSNCDALNYLLAHDVDGSFSGLAGATVTSASNPGAVSSEPNCVSLTDRGAIQCHNFRMIPAAVENRDRDSGFRLIRPVMVQQLGVNATKLVGRSHQSRGPMDDACAMRFYFGRHPFMLSTEHEMVQVNVSGDFPSNARFMFVSNSAADKMIVRFFVFLTSFSMRVVYNQKELQPLQRLPTMSDPVGSYAFDPQQNLLYLVVQGNANAPSNPNLYNYEIKTINTVQLNLTFSMSLQDFFDEAKLVQNLATLLEIPASRIKVVSVHEVNLNQAKEEAASKKKSGQEVLDLSFIENSRRRRDDDDAPGVVFQLEIGDADNGTSAIPVDDEGQQDQDDYFDSLMQRFSNVSTSGTLKSTLQRELGVTVEAVSLLPPASYGASTSAFSLDVDPPPEEEEDPFTPGASSSSSDSIVIVASVVGVVVVASVVVILIASRRHLVIEGKQESSSDEELGLRSSGPVTIADTIKSIEADTAKPASRRSSFFSRSRKSKKSAKAKNAATLDRMSSRRGMQPIDGDLVGAEKNWDTEESKLNTIQRLGAPTVEERIAALNMMQYRVVSRKTWEYIQHWDWYHPRLGKDKAASIVASKPVNTFLIYGRQEIFLCVQTPSGVRHERISHVPDRGFQLANSDVFHSDLASLVNYHREARSEVRFVLLSEEENDVHFNIPEPETNTLTGEDQGVQQPNYTSEDLQALDSTIFNHLAQQPEQAGDEEEIRLDSRYVRKSSLRTQDSIKAFKPLVITELDEATNEHEEW